MKRLYILLLSLLVTVSVIAQPVCQVKHFSVNDGLAQGNVMGMLQDRNGLIWFSTWNGLSKYDGYTFKTYKTSQEDRYAFGSNRMGTIMESKYGDIWCPTYDGQACLFDVETESSSMSCSRLNTPPNTPTMSSVSNRSKRSSLDYL